MIERKIVIGLITSTEYLKRIQSSFQFDYIESPTAKMIARWCWEYFNKYKKAPMRNIENIYIKKIRQGTINKDLAEEIESEILPRLSNEYEKDEQDIKTLIDDTNEYFVERQITLHLEDLRVSLDKKRIEEAEKQVNDFKIVKQYEDDSLDLSDPKTLDKIDIAFKEKGECLIYFPGPLGDFMNDELVRGAFVSFMGPEKRGKTYWLMELMMRGYRQGRKVAFFEAGDMTESSLLVRGCSYLAKKPTKEKYCGKILLPVQDCLRNQCDICNKRIRECNFGVFSDNETKIRETITKDMIIDAMDDYPDYKPCWNCLEWQKKHIGSVWFKEIEVKEVLTVGEAKKLIKKHFIDKKRKIKISTHINGTLTVGKIREILDKWEREEDFVPDIILIDYADILEPEIKGDTRQQENHKWKRLRALSQETNALVIAPTQTDSKSYSKDLIDMENFSEDKRKFGHVTAMYGMNQDVKGREKQLGVMRYNRIVLRESDFHYTQQVYVLQKPEIGRPFLGSFY
jgi:hypothetical protein